MARRSLSRSFISDPQLQQYYLEGVSPTGTTLGVGSYGSVVEVKYRHASCAAKRMHEQLLHSGSRGVGDSIETYRRECRLMASLRHPNITQFLGLCFLEGSELPLLVMEKLEKSVHNLLVDAPDIPLLVKISILTDTCGGLVYLHGIPSPIVHRDLTATNVLLTSSLTAKISDLGNSRMVTQGRLAQSLTRNPGTTVYMPPEANDGQKYGPSLDVFSFGHLFLYILIQVFPGSLMPPTYSNPKQRGRLMARSEVERRGVYMTLLEQQYNRSYPVLVQLVTQCLDNTPETRPSSPRLLARLQELKKGMEKKYGGKLGRLINISTIFGVDDMTYEQEKIEELQISEMKLETEVGELIDKIAKLKKDKESAITRISEEKHQLESVINEVLNENDHLKTENSELKTTNNVVGTANYQLKSEVRQLQSSVDQHQQEKLQLETRFQQEKLQLETRVQQEKHSLQMEVERFSIELHKRQEASKQKSANYRTPIDKHSTRPVPPTPIYTTLSTPASTYNVIVANPQDLRPTPAKRTSVRTSTPTSTPTSKLVAKLPNTSDGTSLNKVTLSFPLQLDWRCGPDMSVVMCEHIQSVEINGTVYVGGGGTVRDEDAYIVMAYNTQSCQWHTLPPYSTRYFAMTTINNKLVLVGGENRDNCISSELGEWQPDSNQWTGPFPSMPSCHSDPSATSYQHWLVVAGGYFGKRRLQTVEVLDVSNMQWSTGPSTPTRWCMMKSTTIGETWYLMGGKYHDVGYGPDVYSVSLESLISQSSPNSSAIWKKLHSLNCAQSSPLNIGGSLLAVGGVDMKSYKSVSTIQRYVPETNTWVQAGQLPHAVYDCTCIMTSDKVHVMGGDDGKTTLNNIFTSNIL